MGLFVEEMMKKELPRVMHIEDKDKFERELLSIQTDLQVVVLAGIVARLCEGKPELQPAVSLVMDRFNFVKYVEQHQSTTEDNAGEQEQTNP